MGVRKNKFKYYDLQFWNFQKVESQLVFTLDKRLPSMLRCGYEFLIVKAN